MKKLVLAMAALAAPGIAAAQTVAIDISALPSRTVFETAEATPLAATADGVPAIALLRVPAGNEVPPHAAGSGLRILTVIEGRLSWGDGETIDQSAERLYAPGSVLVVRAGEPHWLAAREGEVLVQVVRLTDVSPVEAVEDQMR